ncbi:unnamed protein product [Rhizoctonia solani]|uniref:Protein kinase domain-containing protein n=1 Tax=Rhizoctonia solani TaxID=456999 RepID=A0A8H3HI42_9AGAM|nr:unnamed protein product [Rhizoctonia solani]
MTLFNFFQQLAVGYPFFQHIINAVLGWWFVKQSSTPLPRHTLPVEIIAQIADEAATPVTQGALIPLDRTSFQPLAASKSNSEAIRGSSSTNHWTSDPYLKVSLSNKYSRSSSMQPPHTEDYLGCQSQPDLVSRKMSLDQIADILVRHGVKNMSKQLNFNRASFLPFASGGFGSIHQGELQDGRLVALKFINTLGSFDDLELGGKRRKHAAHEVYTWSKCDHPGVLKALGFALLDGFIVLISPLVQNGPLTKHLKPKSSYNRLKYALEYLHGKGIVHGDIKAVNNS